MHNKYVMKTRTSHATIDFPAINRDRWTTLLADFTRNNRGTHARLEMIGPEIGSKVEAKDCVFDGISADNKDGEDTVWISVDSSASEHLTHGVSGATEIRLRDATGNRGAAVLVEGRDGNKALLELTRVRRTP